jgi:hypothetical protein
MVKRRKLAGFLVSLVLCAPTFGQEMLGTELGNYSGVKSIQLNPSAMSNQKTWLDINFLGADIFFQNNYLYIAKEDYSFLGFFKSGYQLPSHPEDYGTENRNFYHYTTKNGKNAFQNLRIDGPGAMFSYGKHTVALFTAYRTNVSMKNVAYDIANFSYLGLNYRPQQNINFIDQRPFKAASMTWGEIGIAYSYPVFERGFTKITAGISVRRLMAVAGMYAKIRSIDYIVPDDSTINVKNLDASLGLSAPVNYANNEFSLSPLFRGYGFATDFGVTYVKLRRYHQNVTFNTLCAQPYEDYIYRIGVSLIDIGAVKFKTNAIDYAILNRSSYWTNVNTMDFKSLGYLLDTISYKFYGNNTEAYRGNSFMLWLPSALSVQFDYHYMDNWFINASLIYGFDMSQASLSRPAQLDLTPRYESRWFEVNMPVSLYDWRLLRIGLSVRVLGFTVGTEKLGGFFSFNDFTGMDFYFNVKFFLEKGKCKTRVVKCLEKDYRIRSDF